MKLKVANKAKNPDLVTLIDYGGSQQHDRRVGCNLGHPAFQSRYVLSGAQRSWRDDMIALLYTLIYLVQSDVSWYLQEYLIELKI